MSLPAESKQICETAIKQYLHTSRPLLDIVKETFRNICKIDQPFLHSDFARIYYIAESKLNTILRKQTITRLTSKYPIQIFGNKSWESISSHNSNINPTVSYNDIGTIYATSKINLNITAPQLVNTINQRIFDIGAMGEFVITDYRSSLTEYFNDDEIVVYKDKSGLMELTDYYLKNDQARAEKSRKLHDAVIARHTWDIRVKKLIGIINNERKI